MPLAHDKGSKLAKMERSRAECRIVDDCRGVSRGGAEARRVVEVAIVTTYSRWEVRGYRAAAPIAILRASALLRVSARNKTRTRAYFLYVENPQLMIFNVGASRYPIP